VSISWYQLAMHIYIYMILQVTCQAAGSHWAGPPLPLPIGWAPQTHESVLSLYLLNTEHDGMGYLILFYRILRQTQRRVLDQQKQLPSPHEHYDPAMSWGVEDYFPQRAVSLGMV
jgi:hypothetical protein